MRILCVQRTEKDMNDKYTDEQILDYIKRIREAEMEHKRHPLEVIAKFLGQQSNSPQLKRLYGCRDPHQAAGRATHGDAFRF